MTTFSLAIAFAGTSTVCRTVIPRALDIWGAKRKPSAPKTAPPTRTPVQKPPPPRRDASPFSPFLPLHTICFCVRCHLLRPFAALAAVLGRCWLGLDVGFPPSPDVAGRDARLGTGGHTSPMPAHCCMPTDVWREWARFSLLRLAVRQRQLMELDTRLVRDGGRPRRVPLLCTEAAKPQTANRGTRGRPERGRMKRFEIGGDKLVLHLTKLEHLGSLYFSCPQGPAKGVTSVTVVEHPWKDAIRGVRAPGTGIPWVILLGTTRRQLFSHRDFNVRRMPSFRPHACAVPAAASYAAGSRPISSAQRASLLSQAVTVSTGRRH